eukprot:1161230-Pelagomonas_calceolata.AAC.9
MVPALHARRSATESVQLKQYHGACAACTQECYRISATQTGCLFLALGCRPVSLYGIMVHGVCPEELKPRKCLWKIFEFKPRLTLAHLGVLTGEQNTC